MLVELELELGQFPGQLLDRRALVTRDRGRDQLVLRDINLRIKPGTTCALVGGSGSGKSTLSRLARRLHDPQLGRVLLDGHDLRRLALHDLRAPMAVVSQEPTLLSGTIADNNERYKLYNQAEKILLDDWGTCPTTVRMQVALKKPNVEGVNLIPFRFLPFADVKIN